MHDVYMAPKEMAQGRGIEKAWGEGAAEFLGWIWYLTSHKVRDNGGTKCAPHRGDNVISAVETGQDEAIVRRYH